MMTTLPDILTKYFPLKKNEIWYRSLWVNHYWVHLSSNISNFPVANILKILQLIFIIQNMSIYIIKPISSNVHNSYIEIPFMAVLVKNNQKYTNCHKHQKIKRIWMSVSNFDPMIKQFLGQATGFSNSSKAHCWIGNFSFSPSLAAPGMFSLLCSCLLVLSAVWSSSSYRYSGSKSKSEKKQWYQVKVMTTIGIARREWKCDTPIKTCLQISDFYKIQANLIPVGIKL